MSYSLDVFGANRRALEGLAAQVDYQRFETEATYQTLVSNVVTAAIREAALREQLAATQQVLALQEEQGAVIEAQAVAGAVARSALLQQRTQIAQTRALIPPLSKSLAFARDQLAVYAGKPPGEAGIPEFRLDELTLPAELPVTLPSSLVRQRPDIRASEALLHAAGADVGVATANLYPSFNLSANLDSEALKPGNLFGAGSMLWGLAGGVTQPIFRINGCSWHDDTHSSSHCERLQTLHSRHPRPHVGKQHEVVKRSDGLLSEPRRASIPARDRGPRGSLRSALYD